MQILKRYFLVFYQHKVTVQTTEWLAASAGQETIANKRRATIVRHAIIAGPETVATKNLKVPARPTQVKVTSHNDRDVSHLAPQTSGLRYSEPEKSLHHQTYHPQSCCDSISRTQDYCNRPKSYQWLSSHGHGSRGSRCHPFPRRHIETPRGHHGHHSHRPEFPVEFETVSVVSMSFRKMQARLRPAVVDLFLSCRILF